MTTPQRAAATPSLHLAPAKICASADTVRENSDSAGPDSDEHTACLMLEATRPVRRAAQSGTLDIQSTELSWMHDRHGMSMSAFTADPSAGEFTRGMELLARAPDDSGASSRRAAVQDDYLMKLLTCNASSSAPAPSLRLAAKDPPALAGAAAREPGLGSGGRQRAHAQRLAPSTGGRLQPSPASAKSGASAAARAGLGAQRFAGVRARLLLHQDVFLQQMFDLHRCVRRQQQLVAVCDRPAALAAALEAVLAPSEPAPLTGSHMATPSAPPAAAAPTNAAASVVEHRTAVQHAPAATALHDARGAQPLPAAPFSYGSMAARFGGAVTAYEGAAVASATPAAFDPMAAWYAQHYGAQAVPYACAPGGTPFFPQPRPSSSLPVVGAFNTVSRSVYGSAGGLCGAAGFTAASLGPAMPQYSVAAAALPGRPLALSHGDRWWQDPAQVFGPAGVPALVERAVTLQQAQSGGHGGTVCTRRGNEAQSHLQAKAKTLMQSESMPLKKRSFASTHDDGDRAGTASGSNSPGGHGSSQPPRAPKSSQAARRARSGPARKRRGNSSSSGVCDGAGKGSDSSGARGPCPAALQSAASVLLSFSAMTD